LNIRRKFLVALGASAFTAPFATGAQQATRMPRLGVLLFGTPEDDPNLPAFRKGLRQLGYVEGKNIVLEYRFAQSKAERLPALAAELVSLQPNVIFVLGGDVAPFARVATSTIPVVMSVSQDPVQTQLVSSLARPGGNLTGVTFVSSDLAAKRLQYLKEIAPGISRIGILWNPDHIDPEYKEAQIAGRRLGLQIQSLEVRVPADFDRAFRTAAAGRVEAIVVVSARLMLLARQQILDLAGKHRIVLVSGWGPWAEGGALLSYGPDVNASVHRAAGYVDKILKGAKPADLPVEQPTKFRLVINASTAKALGLTIPQSVLISADKVIE
jgi:putative ABC transport system substrate-binding protein